MTDAQGVEGYSGELVDRLIAAVDASGDDAWRNLGVWVAFMVGGHDLSSVVPLDGEPAPGSLLEREIARGATPLGRAEYLASVRDRLLSLVRAGIREDFLVRALRTELSRFVGMMADTGGADRTRRRFREDTARLAAGDPDAEERTERINKLMADTTPEAATRAWADQDGWRRASTATLSDEILDRWGLLWRPGR